MGVNCPRSDPDIIRRGHCLGPYMYTCTEGYNIWGHLNFPMLNPHWQVCKYGPHLTVHQFGSKLFIFTIYSLRQIRPYNLSQFTRDLCIYAAKRLNRQMQVVSRKMAGRLVVPAFWLHMGNQWKPIRSYKGHSWQCFPSVPSAEVMTCDTVQKRTMAS